MNGNMNPAPYHEGKTWKRNKTMKQKKEKVSNLLKELENVDSTYEEKPLLSPPRIQPSVEEEDDDDEPQIPKQSPQISKQNHQQENQYNSVMPSNYGNIEQYSPLEGYTNVSHPMFSRGLDDNREKMMEKLNHLIHLLEEQQDEKTNITEEFILYCFLGIFVIFTVDSFTKAGKYIR
jgi:hypothetical protein